MLSVIVQWLRGHLGPSDADLDELLDISIAEDGWMLVDIVGEDQDVALLRDYLVIPDFKPRNEQSNAECIVLKALSNEGSRRERKEQVPRPLALCYGRSQLLQPALHGLRKWATLPSFHPRFVRSPAHWPTRSHVCYRPIVSKNMKLQFGEGATLSGISNVVQTKGLVVQCQKPESSKSFVLSKNARCEPPTYCSQYSLCKAEDVTFHPKRSKFSKFLIDDVNIPKDQGDNFSSTLGVLENVKSVSVGGGLGDDARTTIDAIFGTRGSSRLMALHVDEKTTIWLVISDQVRQAESSEGAERSLVPRKPFLPFEGVLEPKKPMLALEWKSVEGRASNAAPMQQLYSAAVEKTRNLCRDALHLLQADPMSLAFYLPFNICIAPCRLLAPIATLQVLWTHLTGLLSKLYPEEERQVKKSSRKRALVRSGRNKALSLCMKARVVAAKKGQQKWVNKKSLERAHGAMIKSRGEKSNRKRALANGKYNCMVGRRGQ